MKRKTNRREQNAKPKDIQQHYVVDELQELGDAATVSSKWLTQDILEEITNWKDYV